MIYLDLCKKLKSEPFYRLSVMIQRLGGLVTIPMRRTILGCLKVLNMVTSLLNSCKSSGVIVGSKIYLIATFVPLKIP
jgi:hypothetical protein